MKTAIRKTTAFFFTLLGFTPLLFVIIITIKKHDVRQRMKEELESDQLQTIILPENEVAWMDKHEIWVNDHMFDIHSSKLENGVYTFTGLYDEEETQLVEQERNATGKTKEQNRLLVQFFKCLPLFCSQPTEIFRISTLDFYNSFISTHPVNPFREILTPPPQSLIIS